MKYLQGHDHDDRTQAEAVLDVSFQVTFDHPNESKCSIEKYETHRCGDVTNEEPIDLTTFNNKETNSHAESSKNQVNFLIRSLIVIHETQNS